MEAKQINIKGKSLSILLFILLLGVLAIGYYKNQNYLKDYTSLESEMDELIGKMETLENERDDLQIELDDVKSYNEFYKMKMDENDIVVNSNIEYGLLKKYNLTHLIVDDEDYETYELGQLRVKYSVKGYKEYSDLLKAKGKDYFMKYVMLLNASYDGDGMDHFYEYYPY
jgi:hypothetical protein